MAGNYPDVPAPRIAYDRDGTVGLWFIDNVLQQELTALELANLNDESSGNVFSDGRSGTQIHYVVFLFTHMRDIAGVFFGAYESGGSPNTITLERSSNSTTGVDGAWVSAGSQGMSSSGTAIDMRAGITGYNLTGVRAIRIRFAANHNDFIAVRNVHIFGATSTGALSDRLQMWHPTLNEPLDDLTSSDGSYLDWGDVARGTSQDRTFRIKNSSGSLTANSVSLTVEVPTETTPSVATQHTLSNGGAFSSSVNLGNLSPNQISSVITLRKITVTNATLSLWTGRINVEAGSWT